MNQLINQYLFIIRPRPSPLHPYLPKHLIHFLSITYSSNPLPFLFSFLLKSSPSSSIHLSPFYLLTYLPAMYLIIDMTTI